MLGEIGNTIAISTLFHVACLPQAGEAKSISIEGK